MSNKIKLLVRIFLNIQSMVNFI